MVQRHTSQMRTARAFPRHEPISSFQQRAFLFLLLHIPLAVALKHSPAIATVHAMGCLALGLLWLVEGREPIRVIYLAGYMVGVEPLWRLGHASVFWEYGKYAVSLLLILNLIKQRRLWRADKLPLLYFALMVPSLFVLPEFDREAISFNLSGPFALAVATMFFSTVRINRAQLANLLLVMLAPIVGAAFIATFGTLQYEHIAFGVSTKITSAGYGPNQMSSMLGLGGLLALLFAMIYREQKMLARLMVPVSLWLAVQCALTYSRGGFWTLVGSVLVAAFFLVHDKRHRVYVLTGGAIIAILITYVILPQLEEFTLGTLSKRFKDFETTGRQEIVKSDFIAFKENPMMGLGPGESYDFHGRFFRSSHAHTEYSRMLAEHGSFGLIALAILALMTAKRVISKQGFQQKAVVVSFTAWALLFMAHAAMRLAAASFVFGLGAAIMVFGALPQDSMKKSTREHKMPNRVEPFPKIRRL